MTIQIDIILNNIIFSLYQNDLLQKNALLVYKTISQILNIIKINVNNSKLKLEDISR